MKKVWKWIIGIVAGLIALVVLGGIGFLAMRGFRGNRLANVYAHGLSDQGRGMMPFGGFNGPNYGPGMMGRGGMMMPFGGFFMALIVLVFLALVAVGIVLLVRYSRRPVQASVAPAVTASLNVAEPASAATPAVVQGAVMTTCKRCGRPIQADWHNCPYCGKKV